MSYIRLFILSISIISFPAYAIEEAETSVSKKLDHQLELNGKRYGVVGQSVIVLRNNKPYYEGRQGLSNVEFNIPVQKGHLFPSYSVTKLLTSTLVMQQVENGNIDVKKSIRFYLPYLPTKWEPVTVEHLLTHTSGIPRYFDIAMQKNRFLETKKEVLLSLQNEPQHFEMGTQNRYNNTNFLVLSEILETITGTTYQQLVQEKIFKPLGLKNTGHSSAKAVLTNMVTSYQGSNGTVRKNIDIDWPVYTFAHSALYSTPEDLAKFMTALVQGRLVETKNLYDFWKPTKLKNGKNGRYAFGFEHASTHSYTHVGHDGGNRVKLRYYFSDDPAKDTYTIAYLTNGNAYDVWTDVLADSLMSIIAPKEFELASLHEAFMTQALAGKRKGFDGVYDKALKLFNGDLKSVEEFLINYSYAVRFGSGSKASLRAFEFATKKFPSSANAWDSLAEAWMLSGDNKKAIKFYKHALAVDPNWSNATKQLARLSQEKQPSG